LKTPLQAHALKGNWGTLLLPVSNDDSIDWRSLEDEIAYLIEAGVDGIYSNGTAGEFHNQTEDEFVKIQSLLAEKCHDGKVPFQIGVSHPFPVITLERIRTVRALQPCAFQVILPDWVSTTTDEHITYLNSLAEAAGDIPLVLYNPPHAKTTLTPRDFSLLKTAVPQLIGIKVASGGPVWYEEMRMFASGLSVFVPGHLLATGVKEKVASGAYSNVACLQPKASQQWWQLMQTDLEKALEIECKIAEFFRQCIQPYKNAGYSNPALDKFLATIGGWANIGTRLRWPYRSIDSGEVERVRKVFRKILPQFYTNNLINQPRQKSSV
jgi:4-hydroxy-tetrahydrodipicolinate synthase